MQTITHILEEKRDGTKLVKNFFLYDTKVNLLQNAQNYFSKSEKKESKLNYLISLKNNLNHQFKRREQVEFLVKQPFPNWNIKIGFLKN